ncbi:MAG: VWA domain-containing protein, partial [Candidatus Aminicenantes bacterium]|nr:VWA domain-containing protein [Candidatus Aenigmarchaeota archaeon]NIO84678.1 VWA domain-containing protein [Candidatus Aminicenantes bacterium]NIQ70619.1 VWA domain-containing protein [Candidatus Aminicenantes bacterium]NIT26666.1 VWA domain-containing protein [Candidatus Aminicenantes bacterium]
MRKRGFVTVLIVLCCLVFAAAIFAPRTASAVVSTDVVFVVDESGSMAGEHAWLGTMIGSLDTAFSAVPAPDGPVDAQYGLTGYGDSTTAGHSVAGHKHLVGGGDFGTAAQFQTATGGLITNGGFEDGYEAIDFALNNYAFRGAPTIKSFVLVTDEDRDVFNAALTFASTEAALQGSLLNVVVNNSFFDASGNQALGMDAAGNAYVADGSGGFIVSPGGIVGSGFGTTTADYVNLAFNLGGAAWDLNQLRSGG